MTAVKITLRRQSMASYRVSEAMRLGRVHSTRLALGSVLALAAYSTFGSEDAEANAAAPATHFDLGASNEITTTVIRDGKIVNTFVEKPEVTPDRNVSVDLTKTDTKAGGLIGSYLGLRGELPATAKINFATNLDKMWERKLRITRVTGATVTNKERIVAEYRDNDPYYTDIDGYMNDIRDQINIARDGLDYNRYCAKRKMNPNECYTLKHTMKKFDQRNFAAYGMTEVMPTANGRLNYELLDTLLQNAGANYINSIPALGDPLLSKGFYQFTSYAVRHDGERIEGANLVSQYATREAQISGSVLNIKHDESHRAAFYFATYNMSNLVKKLSRRELLILTSGRCTSGQLTEFVATAHHLPAVAIRNAKQWISKGCLKDYRNYTGPSLTRYSTKTSNNLAELNRRHKEI